MLYQFKKFILRKLQGLGIYIRKHPKSKHFELQRYPSISHLYAQLKTKAPEIQFYELKRIIQAVVYADNQRLYNAILKFWVPTWKERIRRAEFDKLGHGKDNLNAFRKAKTGTAILFEKVFYSHSLSLRKLFWFENHFRELIDRRIKVPKITRYYKGELLTIVYFEYVNSDKLPDAESRKKIKNIAKLLYATSFENRINRETLPHKLFDFSNYPHYILKGEKAKTELKQHHVLPDEIEKRINTGRKVLTHGDLKPGHVLKNNIVVDWDEFGLYPAGLEQAYIYFADDIRGFRFKKGPLNWLSLNFKKMVSQEEWSLFELSFLYFLFIFAYDYLQKDDFHRLRRELIDEIKKR